MANHKHLTLDQRGIIAKLLEPNYSFTAIAKELDKDSATIAKEVAGTSSSREQGL